MDTLRTYIKLNRTYDVHGVCIEIYITYIYPVESYDSCIYIYVCNIYKSRVSIYTSVSRTAQSDICVYITHMHTYIRYITYIYQAESYMCTSYVSRYVDTLHTYIKLNRTYDVHGVCI